MFAQRFSPSFVELCNERIFGSFGDKEKKMFATYRVGDGFKVEKIANLNYFSYKFETFIDCVSWICFGNFKFQGQEAFRVFGN